MAIILFFLFARTASSHAELEANLRFVSISHILSHFREEYISIENEGFLLTDAFVNTPASLDTFPTMQSATGLIKYLQGAPEEGLQIWQAVGISPAYALKLRADYASANGQFDEALVFYLDSVQFDSRIPEVWHEIGVIQTLLGNKMDAVEAFEKARALDSFASIEPLGSLYNEIGEYALAAQTWEQALVEYPGYSGRVVWWRNFLFSLRSLSLWEKMLPTAEAAIAEYPNDAQLYIELGFALQNGSGSLDNAVIAFRQAMQLDEESPSAYAAMGNLMAQNQNFEEASYWYSEAITRMPQNVNLYILRANMSRASGYFQEALSLYEEAQRRFPQSARVLHEMAWTYRQTEQKVEAVQTLNQAMNLDTMPSGEFLLRAGLIFEWAQEEAQAIHVYQQLLSIDPENEVAQRRLEQLRP